MPSWNVHIAHTEQLLRDFSPQELGISDVNAFLVGNILPDIYVGYMVPQTSKIIDYQETHLTHDIHVPLAGADLFWERYIANRPFTEINDLTRGAWAHLVCDYIYNGHTREFLCKHAIAVGEPMRIKKQADFDLYGKSLVISCVPVCDAELLCQAQAFKQYELTPADLQKSCEVATQIVKNNIQQHIEGTPPYTMLDEEFFAETQADAQRRIEEGLLLLKQAEKQAEHVSDKGLISHEDSCAPRFVIRQAGEFCL